MCRQKAMHWIAFHGAGTKAMDVDDGIGCFLFILGIRPNDVGLVSWLNSFYGILSFCKIFLESFCITRDFWISNSQSLGFHFWAKHVYDCQNHGGSKKA